MFGITEFSAVINPPQACILAVGTSRVELDSELTTHTLMSVTLSADARVVSESAKARFLEAFRDVMENPMLMITQPTPAMSMGALFAIFSPSYVFLFTLCTFWDNPSSFLFDNHGSHQFTDGVHFLHRPRTSRVLVLAL